MKECKHEYAFPTCQECIPIAGKYIPVDDIYNPKCLKCGRKLVEKGELEKLYDKYKETNVNDLSHSGLQSAFIMMRDAISRYHEEA